MIGDVVTEDVVTEGCGCQKSGAGGCQAPDTGGCQVTAACNECGPGCGLRGIRQRITDIHAKCAYYRRIRLSYDRGPCCDEYFGGFGPLWDSYCADRFSCCANVCADTHCRPKLFRPLCGICRGRGCDHCDACCTPAPSCDCEPGVSEPLSRRRRPISARPPNQLRPRSPRQQPTTPASTPPCRSNRRVQRGADGQTQSKHGTRIVSPQIDRQCVNSLEQ